MRNLGSTKEILIDIAKVLDRTALESMVEGNRKFAMFSKSMAEAMFVSAKELARYDAKQADHVLAQARRCFGSLKPLIRTGCKVTPYIKHATGLCSLSGISALDKERIA